MYIGYFTYVFSMQLLFFKFWFAFSVIISGFGWKFNFFKKNYFGYLDKILGILVHRVKFCIFWIFEYFLVIVWFYGIFRVLAFRFFLVIWVSFGPKYPNRVGLIRYPNYIYVKGSWIMDSGWHGSKKNRPEPEPNFFKYLVGSKYWGPGEIGLERNRFIPEGTTIQT